MKKLFSLTLSLLMLIVLPGYGVCLCGRGRGADPRGSAGLHSDLAVRFYHLYR